MAHGRSLWPSMTGCRARSRRAWRRAARSDGADRVDAGTTMSLPDAPAAVDHEVVAGDPGPGVRRQERHRALQIARDAGSRERIGETAALDEIRIRAGLRDLPWGETVDGDPVLGELGGE